MDKPRKIRWGWLKFMYLYTLIGAGGFGLGILIIPDIIQSAFRLPSQDPIILGITGSVYIAFALLSILGLRAPLTFAPILILQLCYKSIWLIGVILPLLVVGRFPRYAISFVVIYLSYIIGDLIAIPFSVIFAKPPAPEITW